MVKRSEDQGKKTEPDIISCTGVRHSEMNFLNFDFNWFHIKNDEMICIYLAQDDFQVNICLDLLICLCVCGNINSVLTALVDVNF